MNIKQLPVIRGIVRRLNVFKAAIDLYIPPGHYYSPIVSQAEVKKDSDRIFKKGSEVSGINLNINTQRQFFEIFARYYDDFIIDYAERNIDSLYTPDNGFYSYTDGIFLYGAMRYFRPRRILEVGSGFSSSLMYDVDRKYLASKTELAFIEPFPEERFFKIFSGNRKSYQIIRSKVQNVSIDKFLHLDRNDILFVDSSHVGKTGSDVNFLLFDVLPRLKSGVIVHFHDIFFPFEYPKNHVLGNRWFSWNEAYLLRAFLTNNTEFEIIFWNSFFEYTEIESLQKTFPIYFKGGSASIWIRKL